jgi:hypothetical protein
MEEPAPTGIFLTSDPVQPKRQWISWKWSLVAVVLLFGLFGYLAWQMRSGMSAAARLSDDAVRHFHSQLDSEAYADIVRDSDEAFRNSANSDEIIKFLRSVHSKLGAARVVASTDVFVNASTSATIIRVTYKSTFDQGDAVETFTWKKAGGALRLVRYDIR